MSPFLKGKWPALSPGSDWSPCRLPLLSSGAWFLNKIPSLSSVVSESTASMSTPRPQSWSPGRGSGQNEEGDGKSCWCRRICRTKQPTGRDLGQYSSEWESSLLGASPDIREAAEWTSPGANCATPSRRWWLQGMWTDFPTRPLPLTCCEAGARGGVLPMSQSISVSACLSPFAIFAAYPEYYSSMDPDTPGVWLI